jgi:hypothetical protein
MKEGMSIWRANNWPETVQLVASARKDGRLWFQGTAFAIAEGEGVSNDFPSHRIQVLYIEDC